MTLEISSLEIYIEEGISAEYEVLLILVKSASGSRGGEKWGGGRKQGLMGFYL
jgi:hypothetical protein